MNYSKEDLQRMQIRAVKEASNMYNSCRPEAAHRSETSEKADAGQSRQETSGGKEKTGKFSLPPFLSSLFSGKDTDGIIILFLVYLLIRENADKEIILALLYILL